MNMKLSLSTLLVIVLIVCFSIFIANLSNIIAVHVGNNINAGEHFSKIDANAAGDDRRIKSFMSDKSEHLMWFLQISDLHISIFHEQSRIEQLREFCRDTVTAIAPAVVLASGDLTDAKTYDNMGSSQQLREWQIYQKILRDSNISNKTVWLDIRGNHDNFNIPDSESRLNYYRVFTMQGGRHPHSYIHITDVNDDRYAFLGIDACLEPGPKRPFNFVGMLTPNETENVNRLIRLAKGSGVTYTIAFGHYPSSCIISRSHGDLRRILVEAPGCWVYLCGHFHMLGGLVPNMYTIQQTGLLELELADWKENRIFRVAAMDHGFFSFVDVYHGEWPIVLVTNPKHALYITPGQESADDILRSTHIRVLVFSISSIELVQISIDGGEWRNATRAAGHSCLYVVPWIPGDFLDGVHNIHVRARDSMTRERGISQPFSLDGTRLTFRFWPRVVLMSNVSMLFQSLFGLAVCLAVVPLCAFRIAHSLVRRGCTEKPHIRNRGLRRWARQLWLLASIDRLFYPLVIYPLYLSIGPWTIGEVIDGHIGAVFAWGLLVNNSFLPGSFTYAYGFLHICSFQLPLSLILAHDVDRRFRQKDRFEMRLSRFWHHVPFYIILVIQCAGAYFFWLAYGTLAFFLGPLRTWSIAIALILWYQANTLPKTAFRELDSVWESKPTEPETAM